MKRHRNVACGKGSMNDRKIALRDVLQWICIGVLGQDEDRKLDSQFRLGSRAFFGRCFIGEVQVLFQETLAVTLLNGFFFINTEDFRYEVVVRLEIG